MLAVELRTIDVLKVIELWETDKEYLIEELLNDYNILKKEYRKQTKIYTQHSSASSDISFDYCSYDRINYKRSLGVDETIYGKVNFTKDFTENIKIGLKLKEMARHKWISSEALVLKEVVRLKAREIEDLLEKLEVKVNYIKDFESQGDKWLSEDLAEMRNEDWDS